MVYDVWAEICHVLSQIDLRLKSGRVRPQLHWLWTGITSEAMVRRPLSWSQNTNWAFTGSQYSKFQTIETLLHENVHELEFSRLPLIQKSCFQALFEIMALSFVCQHRVIVWADQSWSQWRLRNGSRENPSQMLFIKNRVEIDCTHDISPES
jgi:hypothetical protein